MRWSHLLSASSLALAVAACSAGAPVPIGGDADSSGEDAGRSGTDGSPSGADAASSGADAGEGACTSLSDPGCDCDPAGQLAATTILVDDLAADRGQVEPASGFDSGAWSFSDGAYRQLAEVARDRDDASFLVLNEAVEDVLIEVTAASTAVTNFENHQDFRQVLVTARASSDGGAYSAVGCGIDLTLDGAEDPKQVVAAELSGSPDSVVTNNRDTSTNPYDGVDLDEPFKIRMVLQGDEMECQVTTDDGTTFASVGGFGRSPGAIGLHTRETQALFRDVTVCAL